MARQAPFSTDAAEAVAIQALHFLAADPDRLERFLALSGIAGADIRAAAATPGFFAGLLDHIAADQALLAAFADAAGIAPEHVDKARRALGSATWEREIP